MKDNEKIQTHILDKYQIIKKLGSGAYGHVWKAKCKKTNTIFALKKIFDAFQHSTDAQRTFRQISILKQLKNDKIIKLQQVFSAQNNKDIYLIFEFMETDLYHLLYEGKLQQIHIKYILYQILLGLHYLHENKLIHRDLKPSNILVNSDCSAKICDFGLVRYLGSEFVNFNTLTQGVATRWYRAPQVLLGSNCYDTQVDLWSFGCILGQILLKNPLFPGNCTTNQLQRILQLIGQPSQTDIKSIKAQLGQVMITEICNMKIKKKADIFNKVQDKLAVDLLYKLLEFNPTKRLTAASALKHQYFAEFYNPMDLQVRIQNIVLEIDQNVKLDTKDYINVIKQKFITKNKLRDDSADKRRKIGQSPKSFSDLKKSRVSFTNESNNSTRKSRLKTQETNQKQKQKLNYSPNHILNSPNTNTNNTTNLFKQLCKQKQRQKSVKKIQSRGTSKQNMDINQVKPKIVQKQKGYGNFQSFATNNNNTAVKKYSNDQKFSSFTGLKKTSKMVGQK